MCAAPVGMMTAGDQRADGDALAAWAESLASRRRGEMRGRRCLRFAFYGRVATEDWQDPVTSRARQLQQAMMLVAGRAVIVAEFFDAGESRALPWARHRLRNFPVWPARSSSFAGGDTFLTVSRRCRWLRISARPLWPTWTSCPATA